MTIAILTRPDQQEGAFGHYLAEILHAEGLADQEIIETTDDLGAYDVVVVSRFRPKKAEIAGLLDFAQAGGRLILIRPSYLFARTLGLDSTFTMVAPAYVRPLAGHAISAGVPHEPIETHVPADAYAAHALPAGTRIVARLHEDVRTSTSFPALLELPYGDGRIVVFTYDLAHAVSLIRQGDPGRVSGHGLGANHPYRMQDLLTGFADAECWHLPQADIHAMLLGNAINHVAPDPQPRWWYYPEPETRSALVLDSDDDWSRPEHFDALIDDVESHGGRITIYLMSGTTRGTIATPEKVAAWRARGHSFGIHHDAFDPAYDGEDQQEVLEEIIRKDIAEFVDQYGEVPVTNRNHCIVWKGYVEVPKLWAELGVDMDLNAVNAGPSWLKYLTGSGRPMRFVDTDGTLIDCFQQSTQAYDDMAVQELLTADPKGQAGLTRRMMEDKVTRYFSPMSMLSHPVSFFTYSRAYMRRCWQSARELGMPVWSAFEWATFTRARDAARIHDASWQAGAFACSVTGISPQGKLTLTLPIAVDRVREASVDGEPVAVTALDVFGWPSILIPVELDTKVERTRRVAVRISA